MSNCNISHAWLAFIISSESFDQRFSTTAALKLCSSPFVRGRPNHKSSIKTIYSRTKIRLDIITLTSTEGRRIDVYFSNT